MPNPTPDQTPAVARYTDPAGREHHVIARRARDGRWQVLDVILVETLTGSDDGPAAAWALAHDYATLHHQPHHRRLAAQRAGRGGDGMPKRNRPASRQPHQPGRRVEAPLLGRSPAPGLSGPRRR